MTIVQLITTHGAVPADGRARLSIELAKLTDEAEGFAGSSRAPTLCWTFFEEQPRDAFSTGAADPATSLYYVIITVLAGAMNKSGKQKLDDNITSALLAQTCHRATLEERSRVWVRFIDGALHRRRRQ